MQPLNSITLHYDVNEDRLLVALNAGSPDACGYWLTRRLTLNFIEAGNPFLDRMSPVVSKTPTALRGELATMEREVALASTQGSVSQMPTAAVESVSIAADLAVELNIAQEGQGFRLRFRGRKGSEAAVGCLRAELQRVIHMLEQEVAKAGWREGRASVVPPPQADPSETKRRAN
jgi:hypothetical protein